MTGLPAEPSPLRLRIKLPNGDWMGPGKADLLQGIRDSGSISAAGRRMGMSYKRAWGLVEVLNAMFLTPLVQATRGGQTHGGACLTDAGEAVLASYRRAQRLAESTTIAEVSSIIERAARALPAKND